MAGVCKRWVLFVPLTICLTPITIVAAAKEVSLQVQVSLLAISTSVHSTLALSEDMYLVALQPREITVEPILALLVDEYPSYRAPIPAETQPATHSLS